MSWLRDRDKVGAEPALLNDLVRDAVLREAEVAIRPLVGRVEDRILDDDLGHRQILPAGELRGDESCPVQRLVKRRHQQGLPCYHAISSTAASDTIRTWRFRSAASEGSMADSAVRRRLCGRARM